MSPARRISFEIPTSAPSPVLSMYSVREKSMTNCRSPASTVSRKCSLNRNRFRTSRARGAFTMSVVIMLMLWPMQQIPPLATAFAR